MATSENDVLAVQRAYELAAWLLPKVEKFKRDSKFTLGERLVGTSLDLLEALASAVYEERSRCAAIARQPTVECATATDTLVEGPATARRRPVWVCRRAY